MEILRHRNIKLRLFGESSHPIEKAAEICVEQSELADERYKGPNRQKRVDFWIRAIEAKRFGTITFIDDEDRPDGLCEVCDHPNKPKCFK